MFGKKNRSKKYSNIKTVILIVTTLITLVSLIFNIIQYQSNQKLKEYEIRSKYPVLSTFRIRLSTVDIERVYSLAQNGEQFSYITNPSFLLYNKIDNIDDTTAIVEFLVIANDSDIPIYELLLSQANPNTSELTASHLASYSTLLIPERIYISEQIYELITETTSVSYNFSLGGNKISESQIISPPSEEMVVFEVGLGAITKSNFDFDD